MKARQLLPQDGCPRPAPPIVAYGPPAIIRVHGGRARPRKKDAGGQACARRLTPRAQATYRFSRAGSAASIGPLECRENHARVLARRVLRHRVLANRVPARLVLAPREKTKLWPNCRFICVPNARSRACSSPCSGTG